MSTALDHGEVTKFRYDTHGAPCTGLVQLSWSKVSTLKIALNKLYDLLPKFSVTLLVRIECFLSVHVKWLWAYMAELGKSSPLGKFLSKMKNDHYHSNSIATKFVCILKWAGESGVHSVECGERWSSPDSGTVWLPDLSGPPHNTLKNKAPIALHSNVSNREE